MEKPICNYCPGPASKLYYYRKLYPNGRDTIESPLFSCEECSSKARKDLDITRGGIEEVRVITFKEIARMNEKQIGKLCMKKGKEINHFATRSWKALLFSIHYQNQPSKKEVLIDSLNWYKGLLDKTINQDGTEFDRKLSGLMACADEILKAVQ